MARDRHLGYSEAQHIRIEEEIEAFRKYHPARPGIGQLVPHLLRSGVFGVGFPKGQIDAVFDIHRPDSVDEPVEGQFIAYKGPKLGQFHKRVLLGLLLLAAGLKGDASLEFSAKDFLGLIGRDVCTANVGALRSALIDLRAATFTITKFQGDRGVVFGLITEASWAKRNFAVEMSAKLAYALEALGRTWIPMRARNRLADGLQTALADLIWSTKVSMIEIAALAKLWNREPVQLGREITEVLRKLKAAGILESYQRRRGRFEFVKSSQVFYEDSIRKVKSPPQISD
ncbi:hypothetical protein ACQ858_22080 [Variovorax ureilyticus]|uniref:hypothetical protein n=1 Tax=Variovorax ureilyticus TaxID=1836198 RepID=UPI003D67A9BE